MHEGINAQRGQATLDDLDGGVYSSSSRGGNGERSIVDIAASACRRELFNSTGGYQSGGGCGTSNATPTVTGAAINFIDWYKATYSDYIDNPAVLFVNLLLMGNRQDEDGNFMTSSFDDVLGAGSLERAGLTTPGLMDHGDGQPAQSVSVTENGSS